MAKAKIIFPSRLNVLCGLLLLLLKGKNAEEALCKGCPKIVKAHLTERQCKGTCEEWSNTFTCITGPQVGKAGISIAANNRIGEFMPIESRDACKTKCLEAEGNHNLILKSFDYHASSKWCGCSSKAPADEYFNMGSGLVLCVRDCQEVFLVGDREHCKPILPECKDDEEHCEAWAGQGLCVEQLVAKNCRKSCKICGPPTKKVRIDPAKASVAGRVTLDGMAAVLMTLSALVALRF